MAVIKLNHDEKNWNVSDWRSRYRYTVFEHKLVFDVTNTYTRSLEHENSNLKLVALDMLFE